MPKRTNSLRNKIPISLWGKTIFTDFLLMTKEKIKNKLRLFWKEKMLGALGKGFANVLIKKSSLSMLLLLFVWMK